MEVIRILLFPLVPKGDRDDIETVSVLYLAR